MHGMDPLAELLGDSPGIQAMRERVQRLLDRQRDVRRLPPVQVAISGTVDLGNEVYTHARVENDEIRYLCPAPVDAALNDKLKNLALGAYRALGCRDLGRIDIRVDRAGTPYFLECNPLPNLGHIDVIPLVAQATGRTYEQIILQIFEHACARYGL
jgi:D-alanine-D-alanine ligase